MVGRVADEVVLSDEEHIFLEAQVRRHKAARSLSDRCRMILLCAEGLQSKELAERLDVREHTVGKWRRRFVQDRIEGLAPMGWNCWLVRKETPEDVVAKLHEAMGNALAREDVQQRLLDMGERHYMRGPGPATKRQASKLSSDSPKHEDAGQLAYIGLLTIARLLRLTPRPPSLSAMTALC